MLLYGFLSPLPSLTLGHMCSDCFHLIITVTISEKQRIHLGQTAPVETMCEV